MPPLLGALGVGLASALFGACRSVHEVEAPPPPSATHLRLYAVANVASAIEPCGCQKDMLGGVDHAAALVARERAEVDETLLVAAGPTFFLHPQSPEAEAQQNAWKAEALARAFGDMGLAAWTPGANDFLHEVPIRRLAELSGAPLLAANLSPTPPWRVGAVVLERGKVRIGLVGLSVPVTPRLTPPALTLGEPASSLERGLAQVREQRPDVLIALFALPRGEALRLVERVPGFHVAVVGKPYQEGDATDAPTPPTLVGETLVVEPANLLQSIAVVDLHIVPGDRAFVDAGGIAASSERERLDRRIGDLEQRIAGWVAAGASAADIDARRRDLAALRAERAALTAAPQAPSGSWFRYSLREVREGVGVDDAVSRRIAQYYQAVNEHNRVALADRRAPPVGEGESSYTGGAACVPCHVDADVFWRTTRHARAYATLVDRNTQYNLECVGCHVTGYERPGGSAVVQVGGLENVQCEVCHGPGSRHVAEPATPGLITLTPERNLCASACHRPPHVPATWTVDQALPLILGPGHGAPSAAATAEGPGLSPEEALKLLSE